MNKKIMVVSIIIAALLTLLPISSVVGTNTNNTKENLQDVSSPLFSVRSSHMNDNNISTIKSTYLGKEKFLNLFVKKSTLNYNLRSTLRLIKNNPMVLNLFLDKIGKEPKIYETLSEYDVTKSEFQSYINAVKNDHLILIDNLNMVNDNLPLDTPLRLGFNDTNNSLAFLIVFIFVILPIVVSLSLIIATITIITCLNVAGCFEAIFLGMSYAFIQELQQPI